MTSTLPMTPVARSWTRITTTPGAFAVASLLAFLALITLGLKTLLEWKQQREFELAQQAEVSGAGDPLLIAQPKVE